MSFLKYNEEEDIMTRKDYIKNKNKDKKRQYKILPIVTFVFILILSIYVYKQLNVYNNVTKITNKIVEENNLKNTEKIYYIGEAYTKNNNKIFYEYNLFNKSRIAVDAGLNLSKIQIDESFIYGINKGLLYKIHRKTYEKELISKLIISDYLLTTHNIYIYIDSNKKNVTGLYIINKSDKKTTKIISGKIYQIISDEKNIYTVMKVSKTKSIVRFDLLGKSKKILTTKKNVSYIIDNDNYIFYVDRSTGSKICYISKSGKNVGVLSKNKVESYSSEEPYLNGNKIMGIIDENLYYINSNNRSIYVLNIKTKKETKLNKALTDVSKMQILGKKIYYSKQTDIGIYRYDTVTKQNEKITSALQLEYVFVK